MAENECSKVIDAIDNVGCNLNSLWTSPSSILVTGILFRASQMVLIFVT